MEASRGMYSMGTAKGAVSDPACIWPWVSSLLESSVPNFTLGLSWSTQCCLVPWFSLFHLLYLLCGLLHAYLICEGVKRGENRVWSWEKLFGAILFFGTFFRSFLNSHLICEMGGEVANGRRVAVHFQEKNWVTQLQQCQGGGKERSWHLPVLPVWEGCQFFYSKD